MHGDLQQRLCLQGPGLGPAADFIFLYAQENEAKESGPAVCDPALRSWQPVVLGPGLRRGTRYAPAALRSNNRGESDDEACVSFGTPAQPGPCARQSWARPRSQKGGTACECGDETQAWRVFDSPGASTPLVLEQQRASPPPFVLSLPCRPRRRMNGQPSEGIAPFDKLRVNGQPSVVDR